MTKFKAALVFEAKKQVRYLVVFFVVILACIAGIEQQAHAFELERVFLGSGYGIALIFLMLSVVMSFDARFPFYLHSGLTRWQTFGTFAFAFCLASLLLAIFHGVLSLAFAGQWADQLVVLEPISGYSAQQFVFILLLNLAVSFLTFAAVVLRKRIGTARLLLVGFALWVMVVTVVPAVCMAFAGSVKPLAGFIELAMGSPYARSTQMIQALVFYAFVVAGAAAGTWVIMRRAEAR